MRPVGISTGKDGGSSTAPPSSNRSPNSRRTSEAREVVVADLRTALAAEVSAPLLLSGLELSDNFTPLLISSLALSDTQVYEP